MDGKIRLALFDFDGTLTRRDTFLEFIRFCFGSGRLYAGLLLFSPLLILMKLHLYPNGKAKQQVFSHFFQGMDEHRFENRPLVGEIVVDEISRDAGFAREIR